MVLTDSEFDEILHDCLILASAKGFEAIPIVEPEFTRSEARQIEDGKIIFSIMGHLPKEEMLKIANGIICK